MFFTMSISRTSEEVEPYGQAVFAMSIIGAIPTLYALEVGSTAAVIVSIAGTIFMGYLLLTTAYVWNCSKSVCPQKVMAKI